MVRTATTLDVFNAIGDRRRRDILDCLARAPSERAVGELVSEVGLDQPTTSKHLRVLREVGLVNVRRAGRHRLYSLNAHAIKAVHDWTRTFERFWQHQLTKIKEHAETAHRADQQDTDPTKKGT